MVKNRPSRRTRKPKAVVVVSQPQPKRRPNIIQRAVRQVRRNLANTKQTNIGRALRAGGAALGGVFGMPNTGSMIGAGISRVFGQGDYSFERNSLINGSSVTFGTTMESTRIRHKEFLFDLQSTTGFDCKAYQISPTNQTLFPWLSQFATNFTEYKFHGLVFTFNTTCGSAISSTNNALGVVGLSTLYNPSLPPFGTKREAEDNVGCVSSVPSANIFHGIECKNGLNVSDRYYVQVRGVTDSLDTKWFSVGNLNIFTSGMQAAGITIGEVWVSYDIEFQKPRILPVGAVTQAGSKLYTGTTVTASTLYQCMGNQDIPQLTGNLGASYRGADGAFLLPRGTASGYYLITCTVLHSAASTYTIQNVFNAMSSNVTGELYFRGNSQAIIAGPESVAALQHSFTVIINKADNEACAFRLQMTTASPASFASVDCTFVKLPNSLFGLQFAKPDQVSQAVWEKSVFDKIMRKLVSEGVLPEPEVEEGDNPPPLQAQGESVNYIV